MQHEQKPNDTEKVSSPRDIAKFVFHPVLERVNSSYLSERATYAFGDAVDQSWCLIIMRWPEGEQNCKIEIKIHKNKASTLKIGSESPQPLSPGQNALLEAEQQIVQAISEGRCSYTLDDPEEIW